MCAITSDSSLSSQVDTKEKRRKEKRRETHTHTLDYYHYYTKGTHTYTREETFFCHRHHCFSCLDLSSVFCRCWVIFMSSFYVKRIVNPLSIRFTSHSLSSLYISICLDRKKVTMTEFFPIETPPSSSSTSKDSMDETLLTLPSTLSNKCRPDEVKIIWTNENSSYQNERKKKETKNVDEAARGEKKLKGLRQLRNREKEEEIKHECRYLLMIHQNDES